MSNFSYNVKSWYMPNTVIGKYVRTEGYTSEGTFPVHIPVLMPAIPFTTQKDTIKPLSNACYCNDSNCKPAIASNIVTKNYLNIPRYTNQPFAGQYIASGSELQIDALDGNVDNLRITNLRDSSYNKVYD